MTAVYSLLSWFRETGATEDRLLQRMDVIRGHRIDWSDPTVSVFARRKAQGGWRKATALTN
jgi:hypothetical protein